MFLPKNETDVLEALAGNLKRLRTTREISQEELAVRAGIARTYVSQIERKKRNISILNLSRIANALEVELYELLGGGPPAQD